MKTNLKTRGNVETVARRVLGFMNVAYFGENQKEICKHMGMDFEISFAFLSF